jgi:hypothetical protein
MSNPCTCGHLDEDHRESSESRHGGPCTVCTCNRFDWDLGTPSPSAAPATERCPNCENGSGYTRRVGRDNDEIVEDCPNHVPAPAPSPSPGATRCETPPAVCEPFVGTEPCDRCAPSPGATAPLTEDELVRLDAFARSTPGALVIQPQTAREVIVSLVAEVRRLRADEEGRAKRDVIDAARLFAVMVRRAEVTVYGNEAGYASLDLLCNAVEALRAPSPSLPDAPQTTCPPSVLADLRARVVGRELGASPEVCLDVGRAYLASEPVRAPLPDGRDATREANPNSSTEEN